MGQEISIKTGVEVWGRLLQCGVEQKWLGGPEKI